jgi:hypothetical protein
VGSVLRFDNATFILTARWQETPVEGCTACVADSPVKSKRPPKRQRTTAPDAATGVTHIDGDDDAAMGGVTHGDGDDDGDDDAAMGGVTHVDGDDDGDDDAAMGGATHVDGDGDGDNDMDGQAETVVAAAAGAGVATSAAAATTVDAGASATDAPSWSTTVNHLRARHFAAATRGRYSAEDVLPYLTDDDVAAVLTAIDSGSVNDPGKRLVLMDALGACAHAWAFASSYSVRRGVFDASTTELRSTAKTQPQLSAMPWPDKPRRHASRRCFVHVVVTQAEACVAAAPGACPVSRARACKPLSLSAPCHVAALLLCWDACHARTVAHPLRRVHWLVSPTTLQVAPHRCRGCSHTPLP